MIAQRNARPTKNCPDGDDLYLVIGPPFVICPSVGYWLVRDPAISLFLSLSRESY